MFVFISVGVRLQIKKGRVLNQKHLVQNKKPLVDSENGILKKENTWRVNQHYIHDVELE